jgi:RNA polymerase sigma factor (sigma-70 family)
MLKQSPSRLLESLRRLGRDSTGDLGSDAALLGRFVEQRDEAAFEAILRRHADMVLRTCQRHLGPGPDADDAFQAVFLLLARDAARITRRESLAGWLFRVAYHVSRKLMGKIARRRTQPIREEDRLQSADMNAVEQSELRSELEREVNSLPDRLRAPVVLCYLEGHSNSEAAALLGVPKGTIDSRLAAARKKLRNRLLQRGFALSAAGALETCLSAEGTAAVPGLVRRTLEAAMALVKTGDAAGIVSREVLSLVAGVANTMSKHRLSLILLAVVLLATAGGTGLTVFNAKADGPAPPPAGKKPEKGKPDTTSKPLLQTADSAEPAKGTDIFEMLKQPLDVDAEIQSMPLKQFLDLLQTKFSVPIRIDLAAFRRINRDAVDLYEQPVRLPVVRGISLGDALRDALAQLGQEGGTGPTTFRIRNGQIAIVPAFRPSFFSVGNGNPDEGMLVPTNEFIEQEEGEPITLSVEEKPFSEVLNELRKSTGANIVLDARQKDKAKLAVTATLYDVRLMAALRVLGDMCELQPVALNNVFYVTSKENAEKLQAEIDRRRFGDRAASGATGPGNVGPGGVGVVPGVAGGQLGVAGQPTIPGAGANPSQPRTTPAAPTSPVAKPKPEKPKGM